MAVSALDLAIERIAVAYTVVDPGNGVRQALLSRKGLVWQTTLIDVVTSILQGCLGRFKDDDEKKIKALRVRAAKIAKKPDGLTAKKAQQELMDQFPGKVNKGKRRELAIAMAEAVLASEDSELLEVIAEAGA